MRILFLSFISIFWASTLVFGLPVESSTTLLNNETNENLFPKVLEYFWIIWVICFCLLFCSCIFCCLLDINGICICILLFLLLFVIGIVKTVIQIINYETSERGEIDSSTGLNRTELTNLHMIPMNTSLIPESERMAKVEEMKLFHLWQWLLLIPFIVVLLSKSWFSSRTIHGCVLTFLGALIVVPIIIKVIAYQMEIKGKDVYIGGENTIVIRNATAPKLLQRQFDYELLNNPDPKFKDCCWYCELHFRCFNFNFYNGTCFAFVADHDVVYDFYGRQERKRKGETPLPKIPRWKTSVEKKREQNSTEPVN